uniref:Cytochrome P450 n=1 Tax=Clastoptera arizonana TaxID=38151 RepID=A0A1B6DJQ9_9HEMI
MSQSILFVDNQRWETLHSKLEVVFKKEETCRYFYLVNHSVENFIKQLKDNNVNMINIHEHLTKLYQNISMILCVGDFTKILDQKVDINKRFNCLYSSKFEKNVFIGPVYPCWFSTLRSNILSKTGEYFRKIVRDVVEFRDNNGYAREDLLQSFLNARGGMKAHAKLDEDFEFDNDAVVAQSLTMLLLGKDMLSNTTAFCLYELSKQPDIQKRVTNELKTVMKKYDGFSPKSLLELGYLRQVVTETLRKYPSIPVFTRACTKKYSQNEGQLCLEPGDVVAIPIYAIQNDNQHFPLADVFMPERFSDEEKHKIKSGTFLPFGHGSRRCIAEDLSLMQIFLVLTSILSHFELFPCKEEIALSNSSFLTSPKNGVCLQLIKRETPIVSL